MMAGSIRLFVLLTAAFVAASCGGRQEHDIEYSIILSGGNVYDGSGSAATVTDVGIINERIAAIGDLSDEPAELRLDASGLALIPGIIDIHSHAVRRSVERSGIYQHPNAENLIRQGVTTVITGPDGGSPLPIEETFSRLQSDPATVNVATFVGHGSIRRAVMGSADRAPTEAELEAMRSEVEKAMEAGAFGLSSGLVYVPGKFAATDELVSLAEVVADYGGIYISHMREEGLEILESVRETITIGEQAALPTQITHHKIVGEPMWGRAVDTLALVDAAIERGVDVSIDQYPYTASSTGLTVLFPGWALAGGNADLLERLSEAETREQVRQAVAENIRVDRGGNDPANVVLSDCEADASLNGKNLAEVLESRGQEVAIDAAAALVIDLVEAGGCRAIYHAMSEEDVVRIMQHPATMIASDGGVHAPADDAPHPRNYGAFARVLGRYVREREVLPLASAVMKMTAMPADRLGLKERGRIAVGNYADIAVFDADSIIDTATFSDPHQYAEGVRHVLVNGVPVLVDAQMVDGVRPGRVIRLAGLQR